MMRFGIIGTNSISHTFMRAALKQPEFRLGAVYSRTEEKGREFADRYQAELVFTSLEELAQSDQIDAVYIASPNSCHGPQAVMLLEHGKHVLCEKPIASDAGELKSMLAAARENHVLLLEAMRSAYDPGFAKIQELLPELGMIRRAEFQYSKYSSRYDRFKEGTVLNAFNPLLANAAVMDIGVYCIHPMVRLFGMPRAISAKSIFLSNGMEGMGAVTADYGNMQAVLLYSKISSSCLPSQIQGEEATMIIAEIPDPRRLEIHRRNGECTVYEIAKEDNNMYYEVGEFIRLAENGDDGWRHNQYSVMEMQVMDEIRRQAGIEFAVRD